MIEWFAEQATQNNYSLLSTRSQKSCYTCTHFTRENTDCETRGSVLFERIKTFFSRSQKRDIDETDFKKK